MIDKFDFAADVLVNAEVVRVFAKRDESGRTIYRQSKAGHAGRFVEHDFRTAETWPGTTISLDAEAAPKMNPPYEPEPEPDRDPVIRLRRIPYHRPELGIIIGQTWRQEGTVRPGDNGPDQASEPSYLESNGRQMALYEVALTPIGTNGKARIVLAHPSDLAALPARVSA